MLIKFKLMSQNPKDCRIEMDYDLDENVNDISVSTNIHINDKMPVSAQLNIIIKSIVSLMYCIDSLARNFDVESNFLVPLFRQILDEDDVRIEDID